MTPTLSVSHCCKHTCYKDSLLTSVHSFVCDSKREPDPSHTTHINARQEKMPMPRRRNLADAVQLTQRQKLEQRPLRAGSWAVPADARRKKGLDEWNRRELEQYLVGFGGSSLADKARFISRSTLVDTRQPVLDLVQKGWAVDDAVAELACRRPRAKAKNPGDCHFVIPSYGIRAVVRKVSAAQNSQTEFERLNKLLDKQRNQF